MKQKNLWIFLLIILLFGIGVGIYFGSISKEFLTNTLSNYAANRENQAIHFTIPHFTILSLLFTFSFFLIGIPAAIAYLFYEGMSIGFCTCLFTSNFEFQGLIYIFLFILCTRGVFLLLYFFFFQKILLISKCILSWIIYKKWKKEEILKLSIKCFIIILILFVYDLILDYLLINPIQSLGNLLV